MKPFRRTLVISVMTIGAIAAPLAAQDEPWPQMEAAKKALERFQSDTKWPAELEALKQLNGKLGTLQLDNTFQLSALAGLESSLAKLQTGLAFFPYQQGDKAREQADRAREQADRAREAADRARESTDRNLDVYRQGTHYIDDREYDRAIRSMDRVIEAKGARADGALYWKAYALNKLGKRDEALATLAEIPKQYPQSRWINDAKALEVEVKQATGPVSPDTIDDEEIKLVALNALMNSEPERALPLIEKVLNEPKNSPAVKKRALYVLAQSRSDRAREIVGQYAKNGSNPDLQLAAVDYLGTFRSKESRQTLADVYASVNDVSVKRSVLRSFMMSRDTEHLLNAAKSETNPDLRREAIRQLGNLQALSELAQLYAAETNPDLKDVIIQAIFVSRGTDKLIEIAKTEKDARLRGTAIHRLGTMRNEKTADALAAMYPGEADKGIKAQIIQALWMQGAAKQLVDVTRTEKDPELKKEGVHRLAMMKSKEATDYMMELLNK